jgi:hypothetical protein
MPFNSIPKDAVIESTPIDPYRYKSTIVDDYLRQAQIRNVVRNEFDAYINGPPTIFATPYNYIL